MKSSVLRAEKDSSWDLRLQCTYYYYPVNLFLAQNKLDFFFEFFFQSVNSTNKKILEKFGKITQILKPQNYGENVFLEFFENFRF